MSLSEPQVRESSIEDHIVADCPRCLEPMLLGEVWKELIVEGDHDVPVCPECDPDQWRDGVDVMLDGIEYWALAGDVIDV